MFLLEVKPWKSSGWVPPQGEDLITADRLRLSNGGRAITKRDEAREPSGARVEDVSDTRQNSVNVKVGGARGNSISAA
jgi:SP family sugar:H+ symporter-like MFS transporter